jgi:hypothetical protein
MSGQDRLQISFEAEFYLDGDASTTERKIATFADLDTNIDVQAFAFDQPVETVLRGTITLAGITSLHAADIDATTGPYCWN